MTEHGMSEDMRAVIRWAREERRMSVRGTARLAGVSPGYYSRVESGHRIPSTVVAALIAQVLELPDDMAEWLQEEALPGVGRDSPYRKRPTRSSSEGAEP